MVFFLHTSRLPYRKWLYYTLNMLHKQYQGLLLQVFQVISFQSLSVICWGYCLENSLHEWVMTFTDFSLLSKMQKNDVMTVFSYIVHYLYKYSFYFIYSFFFPGWLTSGYDFYFLFSWLKIISRKIKLEKEYFTCMCSHTKMSEHSFVQETCLSFCKSSDNTDIHNTAMIQMMYSW